MSLQGVRVLLTATLGAVCLTSAYPRATFAQSVLVQVASSETGTPLAGAFVSLLDGDGHALLHRLTDASGRALIPLQARGGPFRVRAELIGRQTQTSEVFTVDLDVVEQVRLSLAFHAIPLSQLQVEAVSRCRTRPQDASIARVWQEARKALQTEAWAGSEGRYEFELSTFERRLDALGQKVERESRSDTSVVGRIPFASLRADEFAREGFVRPLREGGHQYYGPDAAVLLSDAFLEMHCLGLTRSLDRPGWIGLTFRPAEDRGANGIRGTFWLNEQTAVLALIEYHYAWSPHVEAEGVGGGRVEFAALPDGAWIIERWSIRAPILARHQGLARAGDDGVRIVAIRETGGEVVRVTNLDNRRSIDLAARGSMRGVVWDSTESTPLAGARVRLAGTAYEVVTDSDGRFLKEGLPAGVFTVTVEHPRLDSLDLGKPWTEVEIVAERTTELALATPSLDTLLVAACRATAGVEGNAVVWGVVRSSAGDLVPGAGVHLEWGEGERMEVGADEQARYTACGVPVDRPLRVRASFLGQSGQARDLVAGAEAHRLDLEIPFAPGVLTVGRDTVSDEATDRRGSQGVQGRLVELGGSRYISFGEITIRSASGRVLGRSATDANGLFRLQVAQGGRFLLSANALGYKEIKDQVVELEPGKLIVMTVQMVAEALALEPIVATTEARSFRLDSEGFYRRRAEGLGVHIPPEVIERRNPHKTSDLFFGIPRTRVIEPAGGGRGRAVKFRNVLECWPMVYIDRQLVSTGGNVSAGADPLAIDEVISAADIYAIEVFRSPAEIPSEFNGPNAGCGVVVLWTRRGGDAVVRFD